MNSVLIAPDVADGFGQLERAHNDAAGLGIDVDAVAADFFQAGEDGSVRGVAKFQRAD